MLHGTNVKKSIFLFSVTYTLNFVFLFLKKVILRRVNFGS